MKTQDILFLGALAIGGYLLWRYLAGGTSFLEGSGGGGGQGSLAQALQDNTESGPPIRNSSLNASKAFAATSWGNFVGYSLSVPSIPKGTVVTMKNRAGVLTAYAPVKSQRLTNLGYTYSPVLRLSEGLPKGSLAKGVITAALMTGRARL